MTTKKRRPTAREWDKIDLLYLRGEDFEFISKSFPYLQFSKKTLQNRVSKLGLTEKKRAIEDAAKDHLMQIIEKDKIRANNETLLLFQQSEEVIKLLLAEYLAEKRSGEKLSKGQARATAYNIDLILSALTKSQNGIRKCLGIDEKGNLYEKEPEVLVIKGADMDKI